MSLSASPGSLAGCPPSHTPRARGSADAHGPGAGHHPLPGARPQHFRAGPPPPAPPLTLFHPSQATGAQAPAPTHRATSLPPPHPALLCAAQTRPGQRPRIRRRESSTQAASLPVPAPCHPRTQFPQKSHTSHSTLKRGTPAPVTTEHTKGPIPTEAQIQRVQLESDAPFAKSK